MYYLRCTQTHFSETGNRLYSKYADNFVGQYKRFGGLQAKINVLSKRAMREGGFICKEEFTEIDLEITTRFYTKVLRVVYLRNDATVAAIHEYIAKYHKELNHD